MSEHTGHTVGRKGLAVFVAERLNISVAEADRAVLAVADGMASALVDGDRVNVTGLVSLTPVRRAERTARNPQTGEPIKIPATTTVKLVVGKRLKDTLNGRRPVPANRRIVGKDPKSF